MEKGGRRSGEESGEQRSAVSASGEGERTGQRGGQAAGGEVKGKQGKLSAHPQQRASECKRVNAAPLASLSLHPLLQSALDQHRRMSLAGQRGPGAVERDEGERRTQHAQAALVACFFFEMSASARVPQPGSHSAIGLLDHLLIQTGCTRGRVSEHLQFDRDCYAIRIISKPPAALPQCTQRDCCILQLKTMLVRGHVAMCDRRVSSKN